MDVLITIFMLCVAILLISLPLVVSLSVGELFKRSHAPSANLPSSEREQTEHEIWVDMVRERKRKRLKMEQEVDRDLRRMGIKKH